MDIDRDYNHFKELLSYHRTEKSSNLRTMKIYVFLTALILALTGTASGQTQYTYWVDSSCLAPPRAIKLFKAFDEAIVMAHNAAVQLIDHDPLQLGYFKLLFSPSGKPGDSQYEELLRVVAGLCEHLRRRFPLTTEFRCARSLWSRSWCFQPRQGPRL